AVVHAKMLVVTHLLKIIRQRANKLFGAVDPIVFAASGALSNGRLHLLRGLWKHVRVAELLQRSVDHRGARRGIDRGLTRTFRSLSPAPRTDQPDQREQQHRAQHAILHPSMFHLAVLHTKILRSTIVHISPGVPLAHYLLQVWLTFLLASELRQI